MSTYSTECAEPDNPIAGLPNKICTQVIEIVPMIGANVVLALDVLVLMCGGGVVVILRKGWGGSVQPRCFRRFWN